MEKVNHLQIRSKKYAQFSTKKICKLNEIKVKITITIETEFKTDQMFLKGISGTQYIHKFKQKNTQQKTIFINVNYNN
jgi:hypothetical protein